MIRRLFTAASVISLLLFAAGVAFWVRSHNRRDEARFSWRGKPYALASDRGRLGIDNRPQVDDWFWRQRKDMAAVLAEVNQAVRAHGGRWEGMDLEPFNRRTFAISQRPAPILIAHRIPYWVLVILTSLLPAAWILEKWRLRKRQVAGRQCAACGYDLRASTDRCPECGTPIHIKD